jgi:hypothetical protein
LYLLWRANRVLSFEVNTKYQKLSNKKITTQIKINLSLSQDGISFRVSMPHVTRCKLFSHACNLDTVRMKSLPPGESAAPAQVSNSVMAPNHRGRKMPTEESVHVVDQVLQMGLEP